MWVNLASFKTRTIRRTNHRQSWSYNIICSRYKILGTNNYSYFNVIIAAGGVTRWRQNVCNRIRSSSGAKRRSDNKLSMDFFRAVSLQVFGATRDDVYMLEKNYAFIGGGGGGEEVAPRLPRSVSVYRSRNRWHNDGIIVPAVPRWPKTRWSHHRC